MARTQSQPLESDEASIDAYDAIVIGAGLTGLHQLYRLRELGLTVRVFEAGGGVGGTWYWNRYPGARYDSESYAYGYSFSDEVLQEWDWKELFSAQPDSERYFNYVADKFDLRRDIEFDSRIAAMTYDEAANCWEIRTEAGRRARARFLITAIGLLSAPFFPEIKGRERFEGECYHTGLWPHEPVDFNGKRVAVIGTGASGVQLISAIGGDVSQLTVFQRTPNYCAPLHNRAIDPEMQADIKTRYKEIFETCRTTSTGQIHNYDPRYAMEMDPAERLARYEELWAEPGFGKWLGNFRDIATDPEAAETMSAFARSKIAERVKDPAVAEMLTPKDHPFGAKRVPLETHYYEVYNQDNVLLVDLNEEPIEEILPGGIKTGRGEYEVDMIVFATGFDAITGSFNRIDIRGVGGQALKAKWAEGPSTYLGMAGTGFPNLFMAVGPHNAATTCNVPRCSEQNVEWITDCIRHMRENDYHRIEPTPDAEDAWTTEVVEAAEKSLVATTKSWFFGNNIPGKKRFFLGYFGGFPAYIKKCDEVAAAGYEGFEFE